MTERHVGRRVCRRTPQCLRKYIPPSILEPRDVLLSPGANMAPTFPYRPLKRDPPEIRLLELNPAAERALPLECTLRHSALSLARYSCLSYVWGDPKKDEKSTIGIAYKKTFGEHFKPKRRRGSESNKYHMQITRLLLLYRSET